MKKSFILTLFLNLTLFQASEASDRSSAADLSPSQTRMTLRSHTSKKEVSELKMSLPQASISSEKVLKKAQEEKAQEEKDEEEPSYPTFESLTLSLEYVYDCYQLGRYKKLSYRKACKALYGPIQNAVGTEERSIYSGTKELTSLKINCEHVVPQCIFRYKQPMKSTLCHMYPVFWSLNSLRNNRKYEEIDDSKAQFMYCTGKKNKDQGSVIDETGTICELGENNTFEPNHASKGNVARACACFFTHYPQFLCEMYRVIDINIMLSWHKEDPADDVEKKRDEAIFKIQGVHNPYIIDTSLMEKVWGPFQYMDLSRSPIP